MKTRLWIAALCLALFLPMFSPRAGADITLLKTDDTTFGFYGFLKFNAVYQDHGMNSTLAGRYPLPDSPENDSGSTNLTAMDSRFGFRWTGPSLASGTQVKGTFEWDLYDTAGRNQMKLRTRLAFLELKSASYSLQAGQNWDLFAAGLPRTLLTNGFYWETGNLGFRRAQLRYTKFFTSGELAVSIGDPTTDAAIKNNMPLFSARYGMFVGPAHMGVVGLSVAYSRETTGADKVDIRGVGLDWNLALPHSFSLLGEFSKGQNMKIFLSRAGTYTDSHGRLRGMDGSSGWVEILHTGDVFDVYAGYSTERLKKEQVAPGALGDSDAVFLGVNRKLGRGVGCGWEFTRFTGDYKGLKRAAANELMFSMMYSF
jgi:hypothetical protein